MGAEFWVFFPSLRPTCRQGVGVVLGTPEPALNIFFFPASASWHPPGAFGVLLEHPEMHLPAPSPVCAPRGARPETKNLQKKNQKPPKKPQKPPRRAWGLEVEERRLFFGIPRVPLGGGCAATRSALRPDPSAGAGGAAGLCPCLLLPPLLPRVRNPGTVGEASPP